MRRKAAVFYMYIASLGVFLLIIVTVWSYRVKKPSVQFDTGCALAPILPLKNKTRLLLMSHLRWCVLVNYNKKAGSVLEILISPRQRAEIPGTFHFFEKQWVGKGTLASTGSSHCCAQPKIFIIVALNEHITCRNLSQTS